MTHEITGLVLTFNGERTLEKCLRSLDFCQRILVVDSKSTDGTRAIAEKCGADVLERSWEGPAPQFEFALTKINTPWVLSIDQDEHISPELRASILEVGAKPHQENLAGYLCPRRSYYFNRFMKHSGWYPDYLFRYFRPEKMDVHVSGPHYSFHAKGITKKLTGDIVHYPYKDLGEHLGKIEYYTHVAAKDLLAKGKKGGLLAGLGHGLARFAKIYLVRRGFLDGKAGLILAIHGFLYGFLKYVRVEELRQAENSKQEKS